MVRGSGEQVEAVGAAWLLAVGRPDGPASAVATGDLVRVAVRLGEDGEGGALAWDVDLALPVDVEEEESLAALEAEVPGASAVVRAEGRRLKVEDRTVRPEVRAVLLDPGLAQPAELLEAVAVVRQVRAVRVAGTGMLVLRLRFSADPDEVAVGLVARLGRRVALRFVGPQVALPFPALAPVPSVPLAAEHGDVVEASDGDGARVVGRVRAMQADYLLVEVAFTQRAVRVERDAVRSVVRLRAPDGSKLVAPQVKRLRDSAQAAGLPDTWATLLDGLAAAWGGGAVEPGGGGTWTLSDEVTEAVVAALADQAQP